MNWGLLAGLELAEGAGLVSQRVGGGAGLVRGLLGCGGEVGVFLSKLCAAEGLGEGTELIRSDLCGLGCFLGGGGCGLILSDGLAGLRLLQ